MTSTATICWTQIQREQFETALDSYLPSANSTLHSAMRYSTLNGGKRLRPLLVYATGLSLDGQHEHLDRSAIAIELIHCYSLVHDDLPAMDDDDLRRGKPSCHKQFDEATAILVGDALQTLAFDVLSQQAMPNHIEVIQALSKASGSCGMAGGQSLDILASKDITTITELQTIHHLKTGALFSAAIRMGALASGHCNAKQLIILQHFSEHFGLAFQIRDDILDIESNNNDLGKTTGKDASQNKATYPALIGLDNSKQQLQYHLAQAQSCIQQLGQNFERLERVFNSI
jgi:farnesyl diphosphate synthase